MTELNPVPTEEQVSAGGPTQTENKVVRVAAILIGGASIASAFYFFIAFQLAAWQMYALAVDLALFVPVAVVALRKIRSGHIKTGSWMLIIAMLVIFLASVFLVSNVGWLFGLILVALIFVTADQTLDRTSRRQALIASIGVGVLMTMADILPLNYRILVPQLQVFAPTLASVMLLAIGLFVAIRAWGGSMRNKLLVAFIGVTVVATGVLGAFMYITTSNNLRTNLERELSAQANDRATRIGNLLNEQINALTTLSFNEALQDAVKTQNGSYVGSASAIQATLNSLDEQWRAADAADNNNDFLVQWHLTNAVARELVEYQQVFPDNIEVFATDVYGGLLGTTDRTSDYYQADEGWWQAAYNNGEGSVYISEPEFDESAGAVAVLIALPLRNQDTGEITGILRTTYIVSPLASILSEKVGQTGVADLYIPGEVGTHFHEGEFVPTEAGEFEALQAVADQGLVEMDYEGTSSVVTQAQVQTLVGNPFVDKLGWIVIFHQQRDEAFAPVTAQVRGLVIVLAVVVALAAAAAYFLSLVLIRPILRLTATAEEVSAGDLNSRAEVTNADEIGILATTFNTMTSRLRETLQGLEQRVAERTQNLELAAKVGRSVSRVGALDIMLKDACDLIQKEFDLYYVQVYLTNPSQTELRLQAGTGEAGAQLLERGHKLPLNTGSINGRAALEKRAVVISDTAESATFRPNELLPDTRGEMAVPLIVGEEVVGVLDMQSSQPGTLNEEVLLAFEALAGQLAIAIQNARLLAEAEQALDEVETQARRQIRAGWGEHLDAIHKPEHLGFVFDKNRVVPLGEADEAPDESRAVSAPISITGEMLGSLVVELEEGNRNEQTDVIVNTVARQVAQQIENLRLLESAERYRFEAEQAVRRQTREGWQEYIKSKTDANLSYLYDLNEVRPHRNGHETDKSAFSLPLKVRDETLGRLTVDGLTPDDTESLELANAVAERLGAHIESLRLSQQVQAALSQTEILYEIGQQLNQATNEEEILASLSSTAVQIGCKQGSLMYIDLDSNGKPEWLRIVAAWSQAGGKESPVGIRFPAATFPLMSGQLIKPDQPLLISDIAKAEHIDEALRNRWLSSGFRAICIVPLGQAGQWLGLLTLGWDGPHAFSSQEETIFESLVSLVTPKVQSQRLFGQVQTRAQREQALRQITNAVRSSTDLTTILRTAVRELGSVMGRRAMIRMVMPEKSESENQLPDKNGSSENADGGMS
jgi:GAF domain-containing protein/HAMP domain-containing protein